MTPTVMWILIGVLTTIIFTLSYFVVKFALYIFDLEDRIGDALAVLEEKEKSISKILEIPIFYDSPQIRQVLNDVKTTRKAIHDIIPMMAISISSNTGDKDTDTDVTYEG